MCEFYTPRSGGLGCTLDDSSSRASKPFTVEILPSHMSCSFNEVKVNNVDTRFKDDLAEALMHEVTLSSKAVQRIKCSMFAACLELCLY